VFSPMSSVTLAVCFANSLTTYFFGPRNVRRAAIWAEDQKSGLTPRCPRARYAKLRLMLDPDIPVVTRLRSDCK